VDRAEWDERYRQAGWVWSTTPNRFVAETLDDRKPGRALDLACGEGRNALWLAEKGWLVTAVDFSTAALEKGRAAAESRGLEVTWVVADLLEYEPERAAYDTVVIAYLHLVADSMSAVLGRAAAALAPGGMLVVVGHDATNPAEGVGGPQDPAVLYTPDAVVAAVTGARAAGDVAGVAPLRVDRAERVFRQLEGAERPAIDALVVAVRPE
jgi:SAM-dependent methyltransferase